MRRGVPCVFNIQFFLCVTCNFFVFLICLNSLCLTCIFYIHLFLFNIHYSLSVYNIHLFFCLTCIRAFDNHLFNLLVYELRIFHKYDF